MSGEAYINLIGKIANILAKDEKRREEAEKILDALKSVQTNISSLIRIYIRTYFNGKADFEVYAITPCAPILLADKITELKVDDILKIVTEKREEIKDKVLNCTAWFFEKILDDTLSQLEAEVDP